MTQSTQHDEGRGRAEVVDWEQALTVPEAEIENRRYRWLPSMIWVLPLLAALIGAIFTYRELTQHGPVITVSFKTAEGLEAGKTRLRYKDVEIGTVKTITLAPDRSHVLVSIQLRKEATGFQARDSRYWVVRPRADLSGVSGLNTLLSGAYIGVDAGKSAQVSTHFEGLETPPPLKYDEVGSQFTLHARDIGSLDIGSPVLYRRVTVGRLTSYSLDEQGESVVLNIFINSPYDRFVGSNTRFWEASGIDAKFDASGVQIDTQSLMTVVVGGIAFASPVEGKGGEADVDTPFVLASNQEAAMKKADGPSHFFLLKFNQSLRGLQPGAVVDFLGVELGQVRSIDVEFDEKTSEISMPVLIEVFPERLRRRSNQAVPGREQMMPDDADSLANLGQMVARGLRAQLRTGNLLSGQLYVALDFFPDAKPAGMIARGEIVELPTVGSSLDEIQVQIAEIIKKVNKLPFETMGRDLQQTLASMRRTLASTESMVKSLDRTLAPELMKTVKSLRQTLDSAEQLLATGSPLQADVQRTLGSVSRAADSLKRLTDYLEQHPESLLRGKPGGK
ncbi:MAG: MlaD family protein [Lautropia sp.]|nr:MlaD family protein [Lautropia sp.]